MNVIMNCHYIILDLSNTVFGKIKIKHDISGYINDAIGKWGIGDNVFSHIWAFQSSLVGGYEGFRFEINKNKYYELALCHSGNIEYSLWENGNRTIYFIIS